MMTNAVQKAIPMGIVVNEAERSHGVDIHHSFFTNQTTP